MSARRDVTPTNVGYVGPWGKDWRQIVLTSQSACVKITAMPPPDDSSRPRTTVYWTSFHLRRQVNVEAASAGKTISEFIEEAVMAVLRELEGRHFKVESPAPSTQKPEE